MLESSSLYRNSINSIAAVIPIDNCKILVTGASGLIGTCIVDTFVQANQIFGKHLKVLAMGRNSKKLFEKFGRYKDVEVLVQDVTNPILNDGIDYIIHAASNADPGSYALYPVETILTNVIGAKNVLDYCKSNKARVLLTSSFEVNGKLEQDEYGENDYGTIDLNLIRSCYPESKRIAELLFRSYCDEYGVDCVIARLPSVYGPTMKSSDSKAQAQFLRNALNDNAIALKSKGLQKRTYCYVIDAVSGLLKVLFKGKSGDVYNVANDKSIASIAEVAKTIADLTGKKVVYDSPTDIEEKGFSKPQNCILKSDKLSKIGWQASYNLKNGMEETINILKGM